MKKFLLSLLGLIVMVGMVHAQNDTIFILKDGGITGRYKTTEIDSIIFYQPVFPVQPPIPVDSLNIESTQFLDMATRAANYIDTNQKIPNISYIDASQTRSVSAAEFYYMMARWLRYLKVNGEQATPPPVKIVRGTAVPPTPTGSMSGTFTKDDILTKGQSNADFIEENGYVPNYSTVGSTQYSPVAIYYAMAKTIRHYAQNNHTLPATVSVTEVTKPDDWPATITVPTITVYHMPSCGCCAGRVPYQRYWKTWVNYCPRCGRTGTLLDNPKHVYEGEITCSRCDADYCGYCGGDKKGGGACWSVKLTPYP